MVRSTVEKKKSLLTLEKVKDFLKRLRDLENQCGVCLGEATIIGGEVYYEAIENTNEDGRYEIQRDCDQYKIFKYTEE